MSESSKVRTFFFSKTGRKESKPKPGSAVLLMFSSGIKENQGKRR